MKHVLSADQFDRQQIDELISDSQKIKNFLKLRGMDSLYLNKILATVFFEPSTRTRLSFETSFLKLGGQVISVQNGFDSSSDRKGESFQDCIKTISQYADCIVFRHPNLNSAQEVSLIADCPIINAGDGSGEHPTQALIDLYTIYKEKGRIDGLKISIIADLQHARTVHSLITMLKLYDVEIKCFDIMQEDWDFDYTDADVVYLTRPQMERNRNKIETRHEVIVSWTPPTNRLVDTPISLDKLKSDCIIMHPLPRTAELPVAFDSDPRSVYFKQVKNGIDMRMALFCMLEL